MNKLLITILAISFLQGCTYTANNQGAKINHVDLYLVDRYLKTGVPLTEERITHFNDFVVKVKIKDQVSLNKMKEYLTMLDNSKGNMVSDPFSIKILCKIFYTDGSVRKISSFLDKVYKNSFSYEDKEHRFLKIIKKHIPDGMGWHGYIEGKKPASQPGARCAEKRRNTKLQSML